MLSPVVTLGHPRQYALRAVCALALIAVELVLSLLVVPAVPEVMPSLVDLHAIVILHDSGQRLLRVHILVVAMHGRVTIVAEVGRVIVAVPDGRLVLTEITKFNL